VLFTTLTLAQMAHVLAIRSERVSLFRIGLFSNKALLAAVSLTVLLQFALIYVPPPQTIFHTVSLSVFDLAITAVAAAVIFAAVETEKWASRRPGEASQSSQSAPGRRV
jgi:Ca2+-transporting ATPase